MHHPFLLCFLGSGNQTKTVWVKDYPSVEKMVVAAFTSIAEANRSQLVYFHNHNYDRAFVLPYFD